MIKTFEEFVNEGLISDYKKQEEAKNKEVSDGEKKFVLDVLGKFNEVGLPFIFTCKNCEIINDSVKKDKFEKSRDKVYSIDEIADVDVKDIHISDRSVLRILDRDSEWIDGEYKNIWDSIYKWFDKRYEKLELTFDGKVKVERLIELKNDIKKELF